MAHCEEHNDGGSDYHSAGDAGEDVEGLNCPRPVLEAERATNFFGQHVMKLINVFLFATEEIVPTGRSCYDCSVFQGFRLTANLPTSFEDEALAR